MAEESKIFKPSNKLFVNEPEKPRGLMRCEDGKVYFREWLAGSTEYCIQDLIEENEKLKERVTELENAEQDG